MIVLGPKYHLIKEQIQKVQVLENSEYPTREGNKPKWFDNYVQKVTDSSANLDFYYI